MVTRLRIGDRLRYDDGKLEAVIETLGDGEAVVARGPRQDRGRETQAREGREPSRHGARPLAAHRQGSRPTSRR
jgi:hypothetical protein